MKNTAILLMLASLWSLASADTQDYVIGNVIFVKSNVAYFDVGEKEGVTRGQSFEIIYDERIVTEGVIDWADKNISRSHPLEQRAATEIYLFGPMKVKIRLLVHQSNQGGYLNIAYFNDLHLNPVEIYTSEDLMVSRLIHRGLVKTDKENGIMPDICGDFEIRDLTYTFYISPDARFHNGKAIEASDVAYSFEQLAQAPKLTNFNWFVLEIAGADAYRNQLKPEISGIFIIDKKTIAITLKRPFPAFEEYLAGPGGYIIPKPGYISTGMNAVGAGQYRIKWRSPDGVVLEPSEEAAGTVFLDSLHFVRFANADEAGLAFELGRLDLIVLLGDSPPKFVTQGNFSSQNYETCSEVILGLNNSRAFQSNENFGKAISFMLDRSSIVRVLLGGAGGSPIFAPPSALGKNVPLSGAFLPDSAKYYLSIATGMPKTVTLYIDSSYTVLGKVARYVQGQLQNYGIRVKEKTMDLQKLDKIRADSDMDMYLTFQIPVSGEPDCFFYPLLSQTLIGQTNFLAYSDDATMTFLDDMHTQTDPEKRENISFGLARSLAAEPPVVFLYRPYLTVIGKSDIAGIEPVSTGYVDLRRVFIYTDN